VIAAATGRGLCSSNLKSSKFKLELNFWRYRATFGREGGTPVVKLERLRQLCQPLESGLTPWLRREKYLVDLR
jgi:hypothetical protein